MSELSEMIKEAFTDSEKSFQPHPARRDLELSVEQYGRRMKVVRGLAFFTVSFMGLVCAACAIAFFQAPEDDTRSLILYASGFIFAMTAIGWGKMWFSNMQNHLAVVKEIKRTQFMLLEPGPR